MCRIIHKTAIIVHYKPHYCMKYQSLSADFAFNDGYIIL